MNDEPPRWREDPGGRGPAGSGSVDEADDPGDGAGLRERYRAERAARQRLQHRVEELGTALRWRQEQYLQMLGRVQEREEEAVQRALRELSRSEQRFRLVVESVEDYAIFLLDADGTVTTWNRGARRILAVGEEEAVGLSLSAFRPDGADKVEEVLERARTEGHVEDEGWRLRGDGSRFWASETITVLTNEDDEVLGFLSITRDLTERMRYRRVLERTTQELEMTVDKLRERSREAERARADAEEAEGRMRFLAEAGRVLSVSLDAEDVLNELVRLAVPAVADWALVFAEDPEGADADGVFGPAQVARVRPDVGDMTRRLEEADLPGRGRESGISRVFAGHRDALQSRFEARTPEEVLGPGIGGLARELETRSVLVLPLAVRDEIHGVVALGSREAGLHDPDTVLMAEELVRRGASALDNARLYESAVEVSRAKSEFLAVMSHELRTPLNAVLGYVDLLKAEIHGTVTEKEREHLDRIGRSSRHLIQLIEEILSFSRLEVGRETTEIESVVIRELIREVAEMVEPLAREEGLDFRVGMPPEGAVMRTDPGKVRQILLNLLMNAVKFTEEGHVGLDVRAEKDRVSFEVRDTGSGIEEDELLRIFEPFQRGRGMFIGEKSGTGLGLSVSRDLARLLGGEVTVESEPGEGSTFAVVLPLEAHEADGEA